MATRESDINSVIIEGNEWYGTYQYHDRIEDRWYESVIGVHKADGHGGNTCVMRVLARGKLADTMHDTMTSGRGIRAVGYLAEDARGQLYIVAEHVQFKPLSRMVEEEE